MAGQMPSLQKRARRQIERELALIEKLKLAGYFLIVWDIVRFCREQNILVQGRGSAANSAVCYSLGITAVDPVGMELLFERFLSEERGEWPDIDLDLPSGDQRERVIQYVYERYGERGAAMTANVITYRSRSAAREVGKALGFDPETLDKVSSRRRHLGIQRRERHARAPASAMPGSTCNHPRLRKYFELCVAVQDLPRHLGQHSGGMVICQGQLDSVVPLEPASMPGRVVVQWDKEDCADLGIIKVDLLGLGMMAVLEDSIKLIRDHYGEEVDLAHLPPDDPAVYATLQKADTIGMFQVESRAQMSCLPRLRPQAFYDIVVQVAIIRPGPIVGKMVNPYLKRRQGREASDLSASLARAGAEAHAGRAAVSGAVAAHGDDRRGLHRRRSGRAAPRHGLQALGKAHERNRSQAARRHGTQRHLARSAGADRAVHHFVRALRISRIARRQLRADRLCQRLSEVSLPGRVHRRPAEQPADGLLPPATIVKDAQRHGLKMLPIDVMKSEWECYSRRSSVVSRQRGRWSLVVGRWPGR